MRTQRVVGSGVDLMSPLRWLCGMLLLAVQRLSRHTLIGCALQQTHTCFGVSKEREMVADDRHKVGDGGQSDTNPILRRTERVTHTSDGSFFNRES